MQANRLQSHPFRRFRGCRRTFVFTRDCHAYVLKVCRFILPVSPLFSLSRPLLGGFVCAHDVMPSVHAGPTTRPPFPRPPRPSRLFLRLLLKFSEGMPPYPARFPLFSLSRPLLGNFVCAHDVMPSVHAGPTTRPPFPWLPRPSRLSLRLLRKFLKVCRLILPVSPLFSLSRPLLGSFVCAHDVMPSVYAGSTTRPRFPRRPRPSRLSLRLIRIFSEGMPPYPARFPPLFPFPSAFRQFL